MDDIKLLEKGLVPQLLPWDRFSSWVHSICVVTFDLELGQAIESLYPPHVQLSEADRTNICYLAFPDSNSGVMGDSQFHFRIRFSPQDHGGKLPPPATASGAGGTGKKKPHGVGGCGGHMVKNRVHSEYNRKCPSTIAFDPNYLFGYTYFRQVKDPSIRRGYFQKSVILLSKLPLVSFFGQVTAAISRKFFDGGGGVSLEVACHDIDQWPLPIPGHTLELPLMGHLFQVHLPSASTRSVECGAETVTLAPNGSSAFLPNLTSSSETIDLFTCLLPVIEQAHVLWELVLTAEPLVVMASNPTVCSSTVQYLTSIIYPLSYCADYRPFYTIHDSDFKDITGSNSSALPNILLGVTNPFFTKALDHWPHIVKLGGGLLDHGSSPNGFKSSSTSPFRHHGKDGKDKKTSSSGGGGGGKFKFKMDSKPGVYSSSKALLDRDKAMVKRVLKGVQLKRPNPVQSALIRRHFLELTQTFMIPLERYLASLMPLAKNISPYRAAPQVKPFNTDDFLRSLEATGGPQLTSTVKGDWEGLYKRFFKSPNFVGWYSQRYKEVSQKLQLLHLESLAESRIESWMADKEEVQLVDMVLRIRNKLADAQKHQLPLADVTQERLAKHVDIILQTLPEDLQAVLQKGTVLSSSSSNGEKEEDVNNINTEEDVVNSNAEEESEVAAAIVEGNDAITTGETSQACQTSANES